MNDKTETKTTNSVKGKKHRGRRFLGWFVGILVAVVVVMVVVLQFALGPIVKTAASKIGPNMLGTPIEISNVTVKAFSGLVDISGLVVGPPEGFKANVFQIKNFKVDIDMSSLLSDTIMIHEMIIKDPVVSYELSGLRSNIGAIMHKLDAVGGAEQPEEEVEEPKEKKEGKKVIIEKFVFEGAKIRIASAAAGGKGVVVPMPKIELVDIGKKNGGATVLETISEIIKSIGNGIIGVVGDLGGMVIDAAGAVGEAAVDVAGKAAGAIGDTAGKAVGAVGETIGNVGGAAVDTAGKAVGAVGNAAGKVGGAIGGLFGRGDSDGEEAAPSIEEE